MQSGEIDVLSSDEFKKIIVEEKGANSNTTALLENANTN